MIGNRSRAISDADDPARPHTTPGTTPPYARNNTPPRTETAAATPGTNTRGSALCWVQVYPSKGSFYYRLCWLPGGDSFRALRRRHIPGGNWRNPLAQARAETVRTWIVRGNSPDTIVKAIERWSKR